MRKLFLPLLSFLMYFTACRSDINDSDKLDSIAAERAGDSMLRAASSDTLHLEKKDFKN
ncbi:hypothetical protein [Rubrolithibacter danxiaensis]|uniref:hypothetical protein n=1 Tax=Rubrolithibacter danxiaensis TaxID=3390805 RepID=UPI003BF7C838